VRPAAASSRRCRPPRLPWSEKAPYLPRSSGGTLSSEALQQGGSGHECILSVECASRGANAMLQLCMRLLHMRQAPSNAAGSCPGSEAWQERQRQQLPLMAVPRMPSHCHPELASENLNPELQTL
jgi:hypothetical protein